MLEQPEELVGGGQIRRVLTPDVAAFAQRGQRVHRGGHMQRLVAAAVHQLQQLHGELHVAQSAAAEFDLASANLGGHQLPSPPPPALPPPPPPPPPPPAPNPPPHP